VSDQYNVKIRYLCQPGWTFLLRWNSDILSTVELAISSSTQGALRWSLDILSTVELAISSSTVGALVRSGASDIFFYTRSSDRYLSGQINFSRPSNTSLLRRIHAFLSPPSLTVISTTYIHNGYKLLNLLRRVLAIDLEFNKTADGLWFFLFSNHILLNLRPLIFNPPPHQAISHRI